MKEGEATKLAELMIRTLKAKDNKEEKQKIHQEVITLCKAFPVPETFVD